MAVLAFDVQANYEEAQRLTVELRSLEAQIKKTTAATDPKVVEQLEKNLAATRAQLNGIVKDAALAGSALKGFGTEVGILKNNLTGLKNMMLGGAGLGALATQIVKVRGEFQQYEVAFETMLGSAKKAKDMMQEMEEFAVHTPFTMPQVVQGAKQLMAYGEEAEDVIDTLRHLGDVAAGLSLPVQRLVNLYGSVLAQGKVSGLTLRRAMMAGIPITEELGKVMGKTAAEVKGLVTAGKVGANEFRQAIWNMSSEGGKFFNLMDKQAKTVSGQISNIGVALHGMFNAIGESNEGVINKAVGGVAKLVENYETVGKVLLDATVTFGAYKAAQMAVVAMNRMVTESEVEVMTTRDKVLQQIVAEAGGYTIYGEKTQEVIAAKQAEKMTIDEIVAAKRAELAADAADYAGVAAKLTQQEIEMRTKLEKLAAEKEELKTKRELAIQQGIDAGLTQEEATAQADATFAKKINNKETEISVATRELETKAIQRENAAQQSKIASDKLETFEQKVNTSVTKTDITVKTIWTAVVKKATRAMAALKATLSTGAFWFTAITTALTALLMFVPTFTNRNKEAEEEMKRLSDEAERQRKELDLLTSTIRNTESGTQAHKKAIEQYNAKAKEYNAALITENDTLDIQIAKYNQLKGAIAQANAEKFRDLELNEADKKAQKDANTVFDDFIRQSRQKNRSVGNYMQSTGLSSIADYFNEISKNEKAVWEGMFDNFRREAQEAAKMGEDVEGIISKTQENIVKIIAEQTKAGEKELSIWEEQVKRSLNKIAAIAADSYAEQAQISARFAVYTGEEVSTALPLTSSQRADRDKALAQQQKKAQKEFNQFLKDTTADKIYKSAVEVTNWDGGKYVKSIQDVDYEIADDIKDYFKHLMSDDELRKGFEEQEKTFNNEVQRAIANGDDVERVVDQYARDLASKLAEGAKAGDREIYQWLEWARGHLNSLVEIQRETVNVLGDMGVTAPAVNKEGGYKAGSESDYAAMSYDELVAAKKKAEGKRDRYKNSIAELEKKGEGSLTPKEAEKLLDMQESLKEADKAIQYIEKSEEKNYTKGSLESLNRRMSEAKKTRDSIEKFVRGENGEYIKGKDGKLVVSDAWTKANEQVKKLQPVIKKLQASGAENAGKTGKQYAQYNEKVRQEQIKQERKAVDQEREFTRAQIDAMEEGTEKTIAQIGLDYDKQSDAINRWYEDLKEEKIKSAKALWEANPAHKDVPFTYSEEDFEYTEEEMSLFGAKVYAAFSQYLTKMRDARIEDRESMNDYLKEYGTLEEKRLAIEESYNDKILQAKTDGEKKRLEQEKQMALFDADDARYERMSTYGNQSERAQAINREYAKDMLAAGADSDKMLLAYEKRKKALFDLNKEFTDAYGSVEQRREQLSKEWDENIKSITDKDQQGIAKLQKQAALLQFDMQAAENEGNLFGWSKEELEKGIAYVEQQLKGMDKSTDKAKQLLDLLDKLKKSAEAVNDWDGTFRGFIENFNKISVDEFKKRWGTMSPKEKEAFIGEGTQNFASGLQNAAGYMRDIAEASGDVKIAEMADTVEGIGGMLGSIGQGFAQGGFIGAAVAAVGSLLANTAEAFANYKAELKQLEEDTNAYTKSVEMASFQLNGEYESIFGTDKLAIIHEYYSDATRALNDYKDAVKGLANSEVRTYSAHWFERMMGGEHEFTKVKNLIPNLFDSAGNVVLENLESALDSISNLDDAANQEVKKQMEDARDYLTAYKDAMDNLRSSVSEMFGSLANSLGDALVDAVRSGTDAFYDLNKVGTEVVNNLERQMVSGIFKTFLDKYQKEIIDKVGNNGSEEDLLEIYGKMFGELETVIPAAQKAATRFEELAYAQGFDVRQNQNADASSGSYQNISESTGQALEGRFTAIQIQTTMMYGKLEEISMNDVARNRMIDDIRQIQADALVELRAINENTQSVVKPITNMANLINSIKQKVDTL